MDIYSNIFFLNLFKLVSYVQECLAALTMIPEPSAFQHVLADAWLISLSELAVLRLLHEAAI